MIWQRGLRSVTKIPVTTTGQADEWRDVYRVAVGEEIPKGAILRVHLVKQLSTPSAQEANIAWLRRFIMTTPEGRVWKLWTGLMSGSNGDLGMNVSRSEHYESTQESCVWVAPVNFPAGCVVAYNGRAKTSTQKGYVLEVLDKGMLTVEVDTTHLRLAELEARMAALS